MDIEYLIPQHYPINIKSKILLLKIKIFNQINKIKMKTFYVLTFQNLVYFIL